MKEILSFLSDLKENNNREWFNNNKDIYLEVKKKVEHLTNGLISVIAGFDPEASALRVEDCTYRIYRDTRFSPDKTPYKTHIGIFINPPKGKKSLRFGYYLHIEPGNNMLVAGNIGLPSPLMKSIRQSIFDDIDEYRLIVESKEFRKAFPELGEDPLKTVPKGFPKDWEYVDYLRPRNFCCSSPISETLLTSDGFLSSIEPSLQQAKRFIDFFNFTIDDFDDSLREGPVL